MRVGEKVPHAQHMLEIAVDIDAAVQIRFADDKRIHRGKGAHPGIAGCSEGESRFSPTESARFSIGRTDCEAWGCSVGKQLRIALVVSGGNSIQASRHSTLRFRQMLSGKIIANRSACRTVA